MNYTLHQLQIFQTIVKTRSITKAAEALHLTQPAVSIQLKNFQDQFELSLTELVGRRIFITDFGMSIAQVVDGILDQTQSLNSLALAHSGQLIGRLRLSVVSTGKYVMPHFLSEFINAHSGVELEMDVTNKTKVLESLEDNVVDFALVSILPAKMKIEHLDLLPNKLYLVGKKKQRTNKTTFQQEALSDLPFIFRERGSGTRQAMESYFQGYKIQMEPKLELTSNEAVKQAVLAGLGWSIMPLIGIRNEIRNKELQIFPAAGLPIATTWRLIWLKGKKHSPVAKAYLEHLRQTKERIAQHHFDWINSVQ